MPVGGSGEAALVGGTGEAAFVVDRFRVTRGVVRTSSDAIFLAVLPDKLLLAVGLLSTDLALLAERARARAGVPVA